MLPAMPLSARELLRAFLGFLLIAILALGVNPFRGQGVGPFDLIVSQAGWGSKISLYQVRHAERTDVLDYYLPRWIEARNELHKGHIPLWNPLPAGGEPGILNLAAGELTPAFLLFAAAPSAPLGLLLAVLFNLSFGATGAYAFVRLHGSILAGIFAGITIMLCGFSAAWLYWPHVSTFIWICWLLWGIDRATRLETPRAIAIAGVSFPLAGLLLGGFPFVSLLGLGAASLYVITTLVRDPTRRHLPSQMRILLAWMLGIGVASPGLIGIAEWLNEFDLSQRMTGSLLSYKDVGRLLPGPARADPAVEFSMFAGSTGIALAALGSVVACFLAVSRRRAPTLLMTYSLVLLACAAVLVFELVPRGWLAWVPGLTHNAWSRATCLLDIAIGLTAASLIQYVEPHVRRGWFVPLVATLIAAQAVDLATYFRLFNGPVPAEDYYPSLPLVDRIKANSAPFQSTIADDSFLIAGSLGAYGVAEWLGHGFRTEALKGVLGRIAKHPLTTPTSSKVDAGELYLDASTMTALGVRYAIGGDGMTFSMLGVPPEALPSAQAPMPPMPASKLVQQVTLSGSSVIQGLRVNLATYGRYGQQGMLEVALSRLDNKTLLAQWRVPAAEVVDNRRRTFALPSSMMLPAGHYSVTLRYVDASAGDMLSAWSYPGLWGSCSASVDDQPVSGCMDLGFQTERTDLGPFVEIGRVDGIHLLENKDVPAGAYFLRTLSDQVHASGSNNVTWVNGSPSGFVLRYSDAPPGFVVLPMSWRPGWHVKRNGMSIRPAKYLGVLPAVPVDGPAELVFRYRPLGLLVGVPVALISVLILMAGIWTGRRSARAAANKRLRS